MDENLSLNFAEQQSLTTFAYETYKSGVENLLPINFLHVTKEEFQNRSRTYQSFPRLIIFNETDSIKNICYKIFKDMRETMKDLLYMQNFSHLMKEDYRTAHDELFFGADSEPPYNLYLLMKDG